MSILVDEKTKVIVQGITGNEGMFHTRQMVEYGTKVVAGVTPGKGGQKVDGIPVFNTVMEGAQRDRRECLSDLRPSCLCSRFDSGSSRCRRIHHRLPYRGNSDP